MQPERGFCSSALLRRLVSASCEAILQEKKTDHMMKQVRLRGRLAASSACFATVEGHLNDTLAIANA